MPLITRTVASKFGLFLVAALIAGCEGQMPMTEPFASPAEPSSLRSPLAIPDADPSPTLPPTAAPGACETAPPHATLIATPGRETPEEAPPMENPPTVSPQAQDAVEAARAFLARHLDIPADEIALLSVEPETWSDSSLGCPQPGHYYLQVITPGYRILFEAQGREYGVHTDRSGRQVVLCTDAVGGGRVPPYSEE